MAEDDESITAAGSAADSAQQGASQGVPRPSPWSGWRLVTQLAVPLVALTVAVGVLASNDGGGTEGGVSDGGVSDGAHTDQAAPDVGDVCEFYLEDAPRALRSSADVEALAYDLDRAAGELDATDSALAATLLREAEALRDVVAAVEGGNPRAVRRARRRARDRTAEAAMLAARTTGASDCRRLALRARPLLR